MKLKGFTLIELLIVVAIIGILAAIAIPNFLLAQTRAKVSAARAELRELDNALTAYSIDFNTFPRGNDFQLATRTDANGNRLPGLQPYDVGLILLSTPIEYISQGLIEDAFAGQTRSGTSNPLDQVADTNFERKWYKYSARDDLGTVGTLGSPDADTGSSLVDWYILQSCGPDLNRHALGSGLIDTGNPDVFRDTIYDPSNGTVSRGSIYRSGGSPTGVGSFAFGQVQISTTN